MKRMYPQITQIAQIGSKTSNKRLRIPHVAATLVVFDLRQSAVNSYLIHVVNLLNELFLAPFRKK